MYARAIYPPNTPSRFAGLGYDPGWALGHIILLPLLSNLNKSMTMNHTLKFLTSSKSGKASFKSASSATSRRASISSGMAIRRAPSRRSIPPKRSTIPSFRKFSPRRAASSSSCFTMQVTIRSSPRLPYCKNRPLHLKGCSSQKEQPCFLSPHYNHSHIK